MKRVVEPEWLDELPANDPRALDSRRDIQRLSRLMGNRTTLAGLLRNGEGRERPRRIVELGAGDGAFTLRLARHLSRHWPRAHVVLVDSKDVVTRETREGFAALGWTVEVAIADVFDWLRAPMGEPADVIMANLFLHQFGETQLAEMLRLAAERTRFFAACEPWRSGLALALSRMLGLIGCNAVTRHDGVVSVRAGFQGRELSALWPSPVDWRVQERSVGWLTHAFAAERIGGN
jgi:hypothetical protein